MAKAKDIKDQEFGRLVVKERNYEDPRPGVYWWCECQCPKKNIISATGRNLRGGRVTSCGCVQEEMRAALGKVKHGMSKTKIYKIWQHVIERCKNKDHYVGKGITVCDEWLNSFEAFYSHVGDRPSNKHQLDRIKNHLGYEPGNVQWVLPKQNARNRDTNTLYTMDGETKCLAAWVEQYNPSYTKRDYDRVWNRLDQGWDLKIALTKPVRPICNAL